MKQTALVLLLVLTAACGGSSNSVTSPTTTSTGTTVTPLHGSMTATIDGVSWTATAITTASYVNGIVSIGGADSASPTRAIGLGLIASGPGTYQIGTLPSAANGVLTLSNGQTWTSNVIGGTGSITVTTLNSTTAVGTFTFTAVPSSGGATGNKSITSGVFNITF